MKQHINKLHFDVGFSPKKTLIFLSFMAAEKQENKPERLLSLHFIKIRDIVDVC